jgi:hypothetical protein
MSNWPVVPLSEKQLKDVNPEDILENGLYRKCNIYIKVEAVMISFVVYTKTYSVLI